MDTTLYISEEQLRGFFDGISKDLEIQDNDKKDFEEWLKVEIESGRVVKSTEDREYNYEVSKMILKYLRPECEV